MSSLTKTAKKLIVGAAGPRGHLSRARADVAEPGSVRVRKACSTDIDFPPVPTAPAEIERDASFDYCVSELPR